MKFKIHRGTKEIGGSCIEVWTETTRILVDFGMPLVKDLQSTYVTTVSGHNEFDSNKTCPNFSVENFKVNYLS